MALKTKLKEDAEKIKERAYRASLALDSRINVLRMKVKQPKQIQMIEKITFLVSVCFMLLLQHLMIVHPQFIPMLFAWLFVPLMIVRYVEFHRLKWHYFLLDFCYCVNTILFYFLSVDPSNKTLWNIVFVWSNGPLMWAIVMWRTSFVFHSFSHVASTYIHLMPALITFVIRWTPTPEQQAALCVSDGCALEWSDLFVWPILFYGVWQILYLIKTEWIDAPKLKLDPEISTSFRWLSQSYQGTFLGNIAYGFGPRYATTMFVLMQLCYTGLVFVPTYWFYQYKYLHLAFILYITALTIYNGAGYIQKKMSKSPDYFKDWIKETRDELWFQRYIRRGPLSLGSGGGAGKGSGSAGKRSRAGSVTKRVSSRRGSVMLRESSERDSDYSTLRGSELGAARSKDKKED
ncbi:hypothetical protein BC830DRAFT_567503 [Chytriomyces sp. MP71]|nr:hypothetical protein BC830DRAFT_567503 [Chytriomyces sp. MP71]